MTLRGYPRLSLRRSVQTVRNQALEGSAQRRSRCWAPCSLRSSARLSSVVGCVKMRSALFSIVLLSLIPVGHAADRTPSVIGFFSDMRYIEEAGDVVGTEVHIVLARGGHYAVVQCAQGEPGMPVVVPVKVTGQQVEFEIPDREDNLCCPGKFRGTVSKAALTGKFDACDDQLTLKRGRSYWR